MAIELASNRTVAAAAAVATTRNGAPQEQAEYFINLGYMDTNPETGEEVFVSFANGLALDTMKDKAFGSTDAYNWLVEGKNGLKRDTMALAQQAKLAPGEDTFLEGFMVQVYRRKAAHVADVAAAPRSNGLRLAKRA